MDAGGCYSRRHAVGMYASGNESERARFVFLLCFHRSFLMNWASEGKGVPAFLYSQRWRFWYACQRIERASAWNIFLFALSPFNFHGMGGGKERGVGELYSQRRRFWYAFKGGRER